MTSNIVHLPTSGTVRKGTKSCVECRRRKIRCTWSDDDGTSSVCNNCVAAGRNCAPQAPSARRTNGTALSSRQRIGRLEEDVAELKRALRIVRGGSTAASNAIDSTPRTFAGAEEPDHSDTDSTGSDFSPDGGPAHLQQLFNTDSLSSRADAPVGDTRRLHHRFAAATLNLSQALPSRSDVVAIAAYSSAWLNIYNAIFPTANGIKTGVEMVAQYDKVRREPDSPPSTVAMLLLSVAITVQQIPQQNISRELRSFPDGAQYVLEVVAVITANIVNEDSLASTLEGLEVCLLVLRLQMAHPTIRKTWLGLRRIIAIAEMIGVPRAATAYTQRGVAAPETKENASRLRLAAELWANIRSVDRMAGMLFGLPLATNTLKFPAADVLGSDSEVISSAYFQRLADISASLQEVDEFRFGLGSEAEVFGKVLAIDAALRSLGGIPPKTWWDSSASSTDSSAGRICQNFHWYLMARTHLRFALRNLETGLYAYSDTICRDACGHLCRGYVALRTVLPTAFFVCQILDVQVLTAVIFLIHTQHSTSPLANAGHLNDTSLQQVKQVLAVMREVAGRPEGGFTRRWPDTVQSLCDYMDGSGSNSADSLTLKIPLLGTVRLQRRSVQPVKKPVNVTNSVNESWHPDVAEKQAPLLPVGTQAFAMPWSMDISDDFDCLDQDFGGDFAQEDPWAFMGATGDGMAGFDTAL